MSADPSARCSTSACGLLCWSVGRSYFTLGTPVWRARHKASARCNPRASETRWSTKENKFRFYFNYPHSILISQELLMGFAGDNFNPCLDWAGDIITIWDMINPNLYWCVRHYYHVSCFGEWLFYYLLSSISVLSFSLCFGHLMGQLLCNILITVSIMDWMFVSSPNSYVEALTHNLMVSGFWVIDLD